MKTTTQTSGLLLAVLLLCMAAPASAARIVCWTNNDGVRECGNAVPPEYAQQSTERKSRQGITLERTSRARTAEELVAARRERERMEKEEAEIARLEAEQRQYDRVLLATFTTEEDLVLTRDGKLAAIESRIRHSQQVGRKLEASLSDLEAEAAKMERGGNKVSTQLQKQITDLHTQMTETRVEIERREQDKIQLNEQFEEDLARYRELKGITTN